MNEIIKLENEDISSRKYEIRVLQAMLSTDIAKLYHVETKVLNLTIKRNINRFRNTFLFSIIER